MTVRGLKDQTEDIDLALGVPTEFEVEYGILEAVNEGLRRPRTISERVLSNVRELSVGDEEAVSAGIDRLIEKEILDEEGDTVHPSSN
jgi:predicted nucleic acid-binding protein